MAKGLLLLGTIGLLLTGCAKNNQATVKLQEEPYTPTNYDSLDSMDAAPADNSSSDYATTNDYSNTGGATYASSYQQPAANTPTNTYTANTQNDESLTPTGGQSYTVRKGDTLYSLARRFYGDQARWRDIYAANSGRMSNPDRLLVGMQLVIP